MITCKNCKTDLSEDVAICQICNYPIKGSEKEQATFIAQQVIQKSDVEESIDKLKKSRMILLIIGAFYLIVPFTPLMKSDSSLEFAISMIFGIAFVGFGLLTYKKPIIAIGIPFGLIILYYLELLLFNTIYFWQGLIWKVIILTGLGYGYFSVSKANRILKKNKYLASVLGFGEIKNK